MDYEFLIDSNKLTEKIEYVTLYTANLQIGEEKYFPNQLVIEDEEINLTAYDEEFIETERSQIHFLSGRMPSNQSEIALSSQLLKIYSIDSDDYESIIGQTICFGNEFLKNRKISGVFSPNNKDSLTSFAVLID